MLNWYRVTAPIRAKLLATFYVMTGLVSLAGIGASLGVYYGGLLTGLAVGAVVAVVTGLCGNWFREAIAGPYVTTVVRMEGLAAGDLESPIQFTDYQDCVGRLTKAMFTFRDAAVTQIDNAGKQRQIVDVVSTHLSELSAGNLTADITMEFPQEFSDLKTNFNDALENLRTLIGSVSSTALTVRTGSDEIAHASEDLARRTEGNAASLEETSAAIHQIDSRLKATAEAADRSVAGSELTLTAVGEGRSRTDQAVQAMGRVSDSAKGIDSVIEGLDKIAFQTRVLAMNAAVEAGRAGDAGRGFAVVADLVSALAMRAEEEAKRARDQLTVTQAEIVAAVDAVEKVDGALGDISNASSEAAALARQIAADNQAQASAISQVSTAIGQMDEATQQNAAMVEETSAAARNLTTEVANLTNQAAQFKVGNAAPSAAPTPTRVPAKPASTRRSPTKVASYQSPVPQLPAKAVSALTRPQDEDWNAF
jgi:methyl-accepting chemotaxis protein